MSPNQTTLSQSIIRNSVQWTKDCIAQTHPPSPFLPKPPAALVTHLLKSYFERGLIHAARNLFDAMPERDVVAWSAMIAGYTSCGHHPRAWAVFREMSAAGASPNEYTVSSVLKACREMRSVSCGAAAHAAAVKRGLEGSDYVSNALLDLYATCSVDMEDACVVFHRIPAKNAVFWTTFIAGYTHRGDGCRALRAFRQMLSEETELCPFTFSIAVRACALIRSDALGNQILAAIIKHGFESNLPVRNSILDMYCRCGCLYEANRYFNEMTERNLITWNTLVAGHERSDSIEALRIFSLMERYGFCPNCFTFTSVMAACANFAVLHCGQQVHGGVIRRGFKGYLALANAMIEMYAKCGKIADSCKIFDEMSSKDLVSWTSMMIGYGSHGYGREAVELFNEMIRSGTKPDRIVFVAVLSACSHAGLVDEGLKYLRLMLVDYKVIPDQEIYGCVVDLLGRAGRLEEAYELIQSMPFRPDESVWSAFLGACKAHRVPNLGKLAAQCVLDLEPNKAGTYLMLSGIYAADGGWSEVAKIMKLMRGAGTKKESGRSWIEVRNQICSFVVGDKVGSHIEWVYEVLEILVWHMKEAGDVTSFDFLVHDL